jgi:hypothetical protein
MTFIVSRDALLQDKPLEISVWDHDIVTANDLIGVVNVDLHSLLMSGSQQQQQLAGWFPIFDSALGIRGYLKISAKLEFVQDDTLKETNPVMFIAGLCAHAHALCVRACVCACVC